MNQKITPNNVWNLDIIDTFTSEETKIEDAGGLIANAALLYSSRVDDVAPKTNKLIENFSLTVKKKKNLATLGETNKEFTESQWAGGELKKILKDGITTQYNKNGYAIPKANSVFFFPCAEIGVAIKNKTVCPWANKIEYKEEVEIANSVSFAENQTDFFIGNNSVEQEVKIEVPDNKISQNDISEPIMMKGWAGPTFWKLPAKKNNNKPVKKREKSSLDFTQYVDRNMMFQQGDNLLPLTAIKERKKHSYILPVDYKVSLNELYKYITIDGSFRSTNAQLPDDNITSAERAFVPAENDMIDDQNQTVVIPENDQEVVTDFGNVKSVEMARSLFKKCNAVQNKLDINKLKTDITNMVECDNAISLSKLCENVRSNHPEKNVSLQYCIVGLLHLANEKNYKLTKDGENIIINKD